MKRTFNKTEIYVSGISNNKCNLCNGTNLIYVRNNLVCLDCKTKESDIIYYEVRNVEMKFHKLVINYPLSKIQTKASKYFVKLLDNKKDGVLYAVCGAGKTEIMLEVIQKALNKNMRVCFAIPRKEIVKELFERIKNHFPDTLISALYQGSYDCENSSLIICTIHQLLNFKEEFDLIIIDEVDAFPFYKNDYLERLVNKAKKIDGIVFKMSATLSNSKNMYSISRRFHEKDLDSAQIIVDNDLFERLKDIMKLTNESNRKLIIFCKSIKRTIEISRLLGIPYVTSKSTDIDYILQKFRIGVYKVIASTTILERGITLENLDVLVYEANDKVFTYSTLIQICGRVGRKLNDPSGNIYFLSNRYLLKFYFVNRYIRKMNGSIL